MIIESFRIYASKKNRLWYKVIIFDTKESLNVFVKDLCSKVNPPVKLEPEEAGCHHYHAYDKRFSKFLGYVVFRGGLIGAATVSHEMTHAALYASDHCNIKVEKLLDSPKHDEAFAYLQGHFVNQFWQNFYKLKIDEKLK